jgi:adenylate cyclase
MINKFLGEILTAVVNLNQRFRAEGRLPVAAGIGIHSGSAIIGSIGSPERLEFTAIGASVNLASRLQALTKKLNTPFVTSAATYRELEEKGLLTGLLPQEARGVNHPVEVYGLQGDSLIAWESRSS